ncbi:unnamed protein product [Clonostachys byssicola]|uniref:Uncharacterized protein n=1 Tax=Clonostachys byssicola TaxID=160290 RepID=A0A9N9UXR7_9HYPO|nr:unnamed protein product [Clonostachys byssicola]
MATSWLEPGSKIQEIAKEVTQTLSNKGISCVLWNQAAMDVYGYVNEDPTFNIKTVDVIVSDLKFDIAKEILAAASGGCCEETTPIDLDLGHSEAHFLWKPPRTQNSEQAEEKILVGLVRQRRVLWGRGPLEDTLEPGAPVAFLNEDFVSAENRIFPDHDPDVGSSASEIPNLPAGYGRYNMFTCQVYIMRPYLYAKTLILCAVRNYEGNNHIPIEAMILRKMGDCLDRYNVVRDLPFPYHMLYTQLRNSPDSPAATTDWVQRACRTLVGISDLG